MAFPDLKTILSLLQLDKKEDNQLTGKNPPKTTGNIFGGQLVAQAIAAIQPNTEPHMLHSIHAYFLNPGNPKKETIYTVQELKKGKSFSTKQVIASQDTETIFLLTGSFHKPEQSYTHQTEIPQNIPDPNSLPTFRERNAHIAEFLGDWYNEDQPFDMRFVDDDPFSRTDKKLEPTQNIWIRTHETLPNDPKIHQSMLAYISDITLLDTATMPHGAPFFSGRTQMASLDHTIWFHRPFRADKWFLYSQNSPTAHAGRGYAKGTIYQEGTLVASVAQEGLLRQKNS